MKKIYAVRWREKNSKGIRDTTDVFETEGEAKDLYGELLHNIEVTFIQRFVIEEEWKSTAVIYTMFVVVTDRGCWGRGKTLEDALEQARCLGSTGKVKRGVKAVGYINTQTEKDRMTRKDINGMWNMGWSHNYDVGDFWNPSVSNFGQIQAFGKLEEVELP